MTLTHYRSNLRDIEFNLFEALEIDDYLGTDAFSGVDRALVMDIVREINRFATEEWSASFVDADRIPLELVDGEVRLPDSVKASLAAFREGGWATIGVPQMVDGPRLPPSVLWATHELLVGANPTVLFYAANSLLAGVLFDEGNDAQKRIARLMIENHWGGTMVLTEPDAGSDVGAGTTKAIDAGDGTWLIEGVKRFVTSGEHDGSENIVHLVLARPEGAGPGTKGLSMFMVPKYLINEDGTLGERNGVFATNVEKKMGLKGSATCELTFGADQPAVGWLVGDVHEGIRQMFQVIEHARMSIGSKSAATLSTGYLNALEYAFERVQSADLTEALDKTADRVEIIRHPDVRRLLMLQKAHAEGLRALVLYTASIMDRDRSDPDADWDRRSDFLLPLVKGYSSEKAFELLAQSLQVFGGAGYTQDVVIEHYIRDAKVDTVYEGTTAIQGLDLFFRKIARDQGATLAAFASEIVEYVKAGSADDPISKERELLGQMVDDAQATIGVLVGHLMASMQDRPAVYKVGLHSTALLESLAEVTIAWLLLQHAEIAIAADPDGTDPFYEGKIASGRFFVRHVAPKIAARRAAAEAEDAALMDMSDAAF
jgi:hypothetical protein